MCLITGGSHTGVLSHAPLMYTACCCAVCPATGPRGAGRRERAGRQHQSPRGVLINESHLSNPRPLPRRCPFTAPQSASLCPVPARLTGTTWHRVRVPSTPTGAEKAGGGGGRGGGDAILSRNRLTNLIISACECLSLHTNNPLQNVVVLV